MLTDVLVKSLARSTVGGEIIDTTERLLGKFEQGIRQLDIGAEAITFIRNGVIYLWAILEEEAELDTKLDITGVFTDIYNSSPGKYDFLILTRSEYQRRSSVVAGR